MEKQVNWGAISPLLGGWAEYLEPVFKTKEMYDVFSEFKEIRKREIVTPDNKNMFKAFELCKPEDLKLIIVGQDPYPNKYTNGALQATGLSFDCSNSPNGKSQPSLSSFWQGLNNEYGDLKDEHDIRYLANREGILLLNRALSCKLQKTGSLMGKFDFFWKYFFEKVTCHIDFQGTPVLLLGKDAFKLEGYIWNIVNPVFKLSHPSNAARNHTNWDTENKFKQIDKYLIEIGRKPINWKKHDIS